MPIIGPPILPETPNTVYPIPFPSGTQENTTGLPGAMTTRYWIRRHRKYAGGNMICPPAGPTGTPSQFVTLTAPWGIETIYWYAEKEGQPPTVPDPGIFDGNHVFLWGENCADCPMLLPSEVGHVWVMAGIYVYGFTLPVNLDADFPTAAMPFDPTPVAQCTYPAANFSTGILNGGTSTPSLQNMLMQMKGPGG
jgi:hypothetical protein